MLNTSASATNTSMNASGSAWNQTKTISNQTYRATTSDEALKSYAVAGVGAAIGYGIAQLASLSKPLKLIFMGGMLLMFSLIDLIPIYQRKISKKKQHQKSIHRKLQTK